MAKVIVSADSTADLDYLFKDFSIPTLPLGVWLGETLGLDGEDVKPENIYAFFDETKKTPKTAAATPEQYYEFFKGLTADGSEVVHFTISESMSACFQNATKTAASIGGVRVIDAMSLSTGIGLQVLYAKELAERNLSSAEIEARVLARRSSVQASFVVDSMLFLSKGGRCSGLQAFLASVLKIKPCIYLEGGAMHVGKKYMGRLEKSVAEYVRDTLKKFNNPDTKTIFITHTSAPERVVEMVRGMLLEAHPDAKIYETIAGSTVTAHCGKGTLGILYYNDGGE